MSKYDDLFADTAPDDSVFANKRALDPLADPDEIVARDVQERELATILNGLHEGYLPTTVSIYGPPGAGKTLTTRRVCQEFAAQVENVAVEYVNLKECRTLFSAANEILYELTGTKKGAYEGLDGVFEGIWMALEVYPEWTVLILDEIDHITQDSNYDPSDFFYRLLRGEGKRKRDIQLSIWLISNELLNVDLRLDSRVQSVASGEQVFFPPYNESELAEVLDSRLDRAFCDGTVPPEVRAYAIEQAASQWGDARRALTLFRQAGETANERGDRVTRACIDANIETTDRETIVKTLTELPETHLLVLMGIVTHVRDGSVVQPVTTKRVHERVKASGVAEGFTLSERAVRTRVDNLETMGLVETWIDSRGRGGRVKQVETTFDPDWAREAGMNFIDALTAEDDE